MKKTKTYTAKQYMDRMKSLWETWEWKQTRERELEQELLKHLPNGGAEEKMIDFVNRPEESWNDSNVSKTVK
jgi:hypothetical protein